jgi:hypothetical protein
VIQSERNKYINYLVARFLKENQYLSKQTKYDKALIEIEKLNTKVITYQKEIERLLALRNSAEEGGQQFDYFIQSFLGKDDIKIKYDKNVQKYNLYRGNEIAKHLSEGEKMAISFSHYLVTLKSLEQKNELKDIIRTEFSKEKREERDKEKAEKESEKKNMGVRGCCMMSG